MTSETTPKVSIVIPLYNKEPYIARCLEAIHTQTFQDYEIVLVNDGSTDNGPEAAQPYLRESDRIITQQNAGLSGARNTGIHEARGQYVAFIDADDVWERDFLKEMVGLFAGYPQAAMVGCRYEVVGRYDPPRPRVLPEGREDGIVGDFFEASVKYGASIFHPSAVMIDRQVFRQVGYFPLIRYVKYGGEDADMWGRIALDLPVAYTERTLAYWHRDVSGSLTDKPKAFYPFFVITAEERLGATAVPTQLEQSLRRYVAMLLCDYARSLLLTGQSPEARRQLKRARLFWAESDRIRQLWWMSWLPHRSFMYLRRRRAMRNPETNTLAPD